MNLYNKYFYTVRYKPTTTTPCPGSAVFLRAPLLLHRPVTLLCHDALC